MCTFTIFLSSVLCVLMVEGMSVVVKWDYFNGDTTCATVRAGWMHKTRRMCYDVLS